MQLPSQLLINIVKVLPFILQQCFVPYAVLSFYGSSETRPFRHLSNHSFWSRYFQKYISYEGHLFLANVENLIYILKMQKKIQKKFFVFQIIASELVALKISLLSRECVSLTVDVLTNSLRILFITKTDFF